MPDVYEHQRGERKTIDFATVAFIGVTLGAILRTLLPYFKKINEVNFLSRYGVSMVVAIITAFEAAQATYLTLEIPATFGSTLIVLAWSFVQGWGINSLINEVVVNNLPEPTSATKTTNPTATSPAPGQTTTSPSASISTYAERVR